MREPLKYRFRGEYFTIDQLATKANISADCMWKRLRVQKMSAEEAVTTPLRKRGPQPKSAEKPKKRYDGNSISFPASYRGLRQVGGA